MKWHPYTTATGLNNQPKWFRLHTRRTITPSTINRKTSLYKKYKNMFCSFKMYDRGYRMNTFEATVWCFFSILLYHLLQSDHREFSLFWVHSDVVCSYLYLSSSSQSSPNSSQASWNTGRLGNCPKELKEEDYGSLPTCSRIIRFLHSVVHPLRNQFSVHPLQSQWTHRLWPPLSRK